MATNNILDLPRDQFMAMLPELRAGGVDTDNLLRQYRRKNSVFAPIFGWADETAQGIYNEGRTTAGAGLLSKEAGTTGMDALASTRIEPANFIAGLLSGGAQAVDAPAAAAQGLLPAADMPMEALGTAGMAMTGGAASMGRGVFDYDPNTARIFAGPNSKTADLDALARARELSARRRSPDEIWNETGWFKGADGMWRYEIDDSQMQVNPEVASGWGVEPPQTFSDRLAEAKSLASEGYNDRQIFRLTGYMKQGDEWVDTGAREAVIPPVSHAPLASAYDLSGLSIRQQPLLEGTLYDGSYDPTYRTASGYTGQIDYRPSASDTRSTVLHELQHAIQQRENFAMGGDLETGGQDAYRRLAGEVEARNVQARKDFTPEQRAATPPWLTQDVPFDQQTLSANQDATTGAIASAAANGGGFDEYLRRVNPQSYRVDANDRPNLMMGDMYGMLPRDARKVGERDGVLFYQAPDGASYATAFNPDVGEMDVVGYAMPRGDMTDLAVVNEMQGRGIGSELQYLMRSQDPYALTGGLTEAGEASLRRTYNRLRDEGIVSANRDATTGAIALPAARNEAERMARQILEMRAAGRAGEVTDAMMAQADPQYMFNNTPLPMDEASRMARAGEMGFDTPTYHGSRDDITSMDRLKGSAEGGAGTLFSSDEARVANTYATKRFGSEGENVLPLLANVSNYGESGYKTPFPFNGSDVAIEQWLTGLDRFNRTLDNSKKSYFENAIRSARNAGQSGTVIRQVEDDAVSSMRTMPSDVHVTLDPTNIRSRFARFDPEFSHLANLNAANASPLAGILAMPNEEERNRQLGLLFGGYR